MAPTHKEVEAYYFRLFLNLKRVKKINTSERKIRNLLQHRMALYQRLKMPSVGANNRLDK